MDAVKYLKEVDRMCSSIDGCEDCPIFRLEGTLCHNKQMHKPEKAVEIVEKWSAENPQKTILQDFLEKYPKAHTNIIHHNICPRDLGYKISGDICPSDCGHPCWNRPLEG